MDLAREELFSDAAFSRDQHLGLALGGTMRERHGGAHLRADGNNP
jgi:hypothetical protein